MKLNIERHQAASASQIGLAPRKNAPGSPSSKQASISPAKDSVALKEIEKDKDSLVSSKSVRRNPLTRNMSTRVGSSTGRSTLANAFGGKRAASTMTVPTLSSTTASRPSTAASDTSTDALESAGSAGDIDSSPGQYGSSNLPNGAGQPVTPSSTSNMSNHPAAPLTNGHLQHSSHLPAPISKPTTSIPLSLNNRPGLDTSLFSTLRDLFSVITHQPKQSGVVAPQAFITQLKRENELFRSTMHQDAHEFFNYLMNEISDDIGKREANMNDNSRGWQLCASFNYIIPAG